MNDHDQRAYVISRIAMVLGTVALIIILLLLVLT